MSSVSVLTYINKFQFVLEGFIFKNFIITEKRRNIGKIPVPAGMTLIPGFHFHPSPDTGPGRDGGNPGPVPAGTKFRSRSTTEYKIKAIPMYCMD